MEGLYSKYTVINNQTGLEVSDCFVLKPTKDEAARLALLYYAEICGNEDLRNDIKAWLDKRHNIYLEGFMTIYVVFLRENFCGIEEDIVMQVFLDKEQAEYNRDRREKTARENGFDDVYIVKPVIVWR